MAQNDSTDNDTPSNDTPDLRDALRSIEATGEDSSGARQPRHRADDPEDANPQVADSPADAGADADASDSDRDGDGDADPDSGTAL